MHLLLHESITNFIVAGSANNSDDEGRRSRSGSRYVHAHGLIIKAYFTVKIFYNE